MKHMRILALLIALLSANILMAQLSTHFVTTWKTDNPGSSSSTSITIPTSGAGYNYNVDWNNDGTFDQFGLTGNVTHDFGIAGTYTIRIQGAFPGITFGNLGDKQKLLSVNQWGTITWVALNFKGCSNMVSNATDAPNLAGVTSTAEMFRSCSSFNSNINGWNVSSVTNMKYMFDGASSFNQSLSGWNTSNVTDMSAMFQNAASFNQNIGGWNTANVTNMSAMFQGAASFNQNIGGWNTGKVTNMSSMFKGATVFNQNISAWNTANVTNMSFMFNAAAGFNQNIGGWDTGKVTNMSSMFNGATAFNQNIGGWNTGLVTDMSSMFQNATSFNKDIRWWTLDNVTNLSSMFQGATAFNNPLTIWYIGNVTNTSSMFKGATSFNQSIFSWATGNVTNMNSMFSGATAFNENITGWNTANVTDMGSMFQNAPSFNQNIGSWNTGKVTTMSSMFNGATAFNQNIGGWNTSNVTTMNRMFNGATAFNQNIGGWNTAKVTDMGSMFQSNPVFNQNIGGWNTGNVTIMSSMFQGNTAFNQNISGWNTAKVTTMSSMFQGATAFNQNIGGWNTGNVTAMNNMFNGATVFNQNIGGWNTAKVTTMSSMFQNVTGFNQDLSNWIVSSVNNFSNMFAGATLSTANYDALLISWGQQGLQSNKAFSAGNSKYCNGTLARQYIISYYGWTITDGGTACSITGDFVTTWKTDNPGVSGPTSITIPTTGSGYNYSVDWGDGNSTSGHTGDATHTYAAAGTYTVKITGTFPRIYFNNTGDRQKLLSVEQWGAIQWTSMEGAFYGCSNLAVNAPDAPDLSVVTSMADMFRSCTSFNQSIYYWDVSHIENMSGLFRDASAFNKPLTNWQTLNVSLWNSMFQNASSFNQDISGWNVSSGTNFTNMFAGVTLSMANYDALLSSWGQQALHSGVTFSAGNSQYCSGVTGRTRMIIDYGWTISDGGANCSGPAFITTWKTNYPGQSDSSSILIPINSQKTYNYDVDWGDGNSTLGNTGAATHTYAAEGIYTVKITGTFPQISFGSVSDRLKLVSVDHWGDIAWIAMGFKSCGNMVLNAKDAPDLTQVTSMLDAFRFCTKFDADISNWDMSNVTNCSNMFGGVTMSTANYDALLIGWSQQNLKPGVPFSGGNSKYCDGNAARQSIIDNSGWTITDGGLLAGCAATDHFVTAWRTNSPGPSGNTSITIPTYPGETYNYDVDWNNDGVFDQFGITGDVTHNFGVQGIYLIRIRGTFPRIYFNNSGDKFKLLAVSQWGTQAWKSMASAFYGCGNLNITAADAPNLTGVTNMNSMFKDCQSLIAFYNTSWDVSKVTNMGEMFNGCFNFNSPLNSWNVANVTNMQFMFNDCNTFNRPLNNWNVAKVTDMQYMFASCYAFNQDIGGWNVGNVLNMENMFYSATVFNQAIGNWNTGKVTNMAGMFSLASAFNQNIGNWNTGKVTDMTGMFEQTTQFDQNLGSWNVRLVTQMANMFYGVTLSTANYDALLTGWNQLPLKHNVTFSGGNSIYCAAAAARQNMITAFGWNITDGGMCNLPPVALCQDISVFANADCQAVVAAQEVDNGSSDPENNPLNYALSPQGPFFIGNTVVTLTVTDDGGLTGTCTATITVADNTLPEISCPADISVNNDAGECSAAVSFTTPEGTDNCTGTITTQTAGLSSGASFPVGVTTNSFTAEDFAGNMASCSFSVTVSDTQAPEISCPANITLSNAPGTCGKFFNYAIGAADNCGFANWAKTDGLYPGIFPVGTTVNTFVATDASGNTASCSFSVTVNDTENPTINCPADISVSNDAGVCGAVVEYVVNAADNCWVAGTYQTGGLPSGSTFPVGVTINTVVAEDNPGNTASCSFTVTVADAEAPVFTECPVSMTVSNVEGQCGAYVEYTVPSATDNCDIPTVTQAGGEGIGNPGFFPVGATTLSYTAVDATGNSTVCSFTVTVVDDEAPVAVCPASIPDVVLDASGNASLPANIGDGSSTDNCSATETSPALAFTCADIGVQAVTLTAVDPSGNTHSTSCSFNVVDNTSPVLTCQDITASLDNAGQFVLYNALFEVDVTDNCEVSGGGGVSPNIVTCAQAGQVIEVSVFHFDVNDNIGYCTANVTVVDDTPPSIVCPNNMVAENDPGVCSAIVNYAITASDNCSEVTWVQTDGLASGASFPVGVTTNGFLATDASGNTATCSFTITVNDTEAPAITCPENILANNREGSCSAFVEFTIGTSDNCGVDGYSQTSGLSSGADFPVGTTANTFITEDAAGNTATCSFTVTILDAEAPTFVNCPDGGIYSSLSDQCGAYVDYELPEATDNCTTVTVNLVSGIGNSGGFFPVGQNIEHYEAVDAAGNVSTCMFAIVVIDDTAPVINCPANMSVGTDAGVCGAVVTYTVSASDNCGGATWEQTAGLASGSAFPTGVTTNTFIATDGVGNIGLCSFTVTVSDTEAPTVVCPANIEVSNEEGQCSAVVYYPVGLNDNCGGFSVQRTSGLSSGSAFPVGVTVNTFQVTDAAGNTATCSFTVTVNDTEAPTISCPADVSLENQPGLCSAILEYSITATDNCSGATLEQTEGLASASAFPVGITTNTFVITDGSGNAASCSFTVTVSDTEAPVVTAELAFIDCINQTDGDRYSVEWTVSDNCDSQPAQLAVIALPELTNPTVVFKKKNKKGLKFKLASNEITVEAPGNGGAAAWWLQIQADGGVAVTMGQEIELLANYGSDNIQFNFSNGGVLERVKNDSLTLIVSATDAAGNTASNSVETYLQCTGANRNGAAAERASDTGFKTDPLDVEEGSLTAYPNPFTDQLTIRYELGATSAISLEVYDLNGRQIASLVQATQEAGGYEAIWHARTESAQPLSAGIYLLRLQTDAGVFTRKVQLVW